MGVRPPTAWLRMVAVFARPIASALGAKGEILEYCVVYARIILAANPFYILQNP